MIRFGCFCSNHLWSFVCIFTSLSKNCFFWVFFFFFHATVLFSEALLELFLCSSFAHCLICDNPPWKAKKLLYKLQKALWQSWWSLVILTLSVMSGKLVFVIHLLSFEGGKLIWWNGTFAAPGTIPICAAVQLSQLQIEVKFKLNFKLWLLFVCTGIILPRYFSAW